MSENSASHGQGAAAHHTNYVKIWGILTVLLVVSVLGPIVAAYLGSLKLAVTLITAFGVALVKAYLVAKYFMHVNLERRWIVYLVVGMIVLMVLLVGGVSPDVLKHDGARWSNDAAKQATLRARNVHADGQKAEHH